MSQAAFAFNDYQQQAHDAFAAAVQTAPQQLVFNYRQHHGHVVSAALAAHFAPSYPASIHEVAQLSFALDEPAQALAAHVWQEVVTEAAAGAAGEELTALVIAGPKGSGKTGLMQSLKREVTESTQAILFTTLAEAVFVYKRIEEALAASETMHVLVAYIHRPVELYSAAALQQAIETGGTLPLELFAEQIYAAQWGIDWLNDRYRHSSRVHVRAIDASGPIQDFHAITPAAVKRDQKSLDLTKRIVKEAFAHEYSKHRWTDAKSHKAIFETFTGKEPPPRTWQIIKPGHSVAKGQLTKIDPETFEPLRPERIERNRDLVAVEPKQRDDRDPKYSRSSLYSRSR